MKTGQRVALAAGYGKNIWDLNPELDKKVHELYEDGKKSIWAEFTTEFIKTVPSAVQVATQAKDRENYIVQPPTGEKLNEQSVATLEKLRESWAGKDPDVQIVISDGLNANTIMSEGQVVTYLTELRKNLQEGGLTVEDKNILVTSGRVRAGHQVGNILFGKSDPAKKRMVLHIIGERPGTGQNAFSVYIAAPKAQVWAEKKCDHDIVKVVCGISNKGLKPEDAAKKKVKILKDMIQTS